MGFPVPLGRWLASDMGRFAKEVLLDPEFQVSAQALRLKRKVEMYQYEERKESETRKKTGGGSETIDTYYYDEVWDEDFHDSSRFEDHSYRGSNPPRKPIDSFTWQAEAVALGAFALSRDQVGQINTWKELPPPAEAATPVIALPGNLQSTREGWYAGTGTPSAPQIGDVRISFQSVGPSEVTVVAMQMGDRLVDWTTAQGNPFNELRVGLLSKPAMFERLRTENTLLTWGLRFGGFLLMAIGLAMLFSPLVALADVIPFIGNLVGAGVALFAGLMAFGLSLFTIAVAWVAHRPIVGVPLLLGALLCFFLVAKAGKKRKAAR